jgi:hypothetical protein
MTVGIPGTGIGGIFYLMLTMFMPLRELWLMVKGRSGMKRWVTVVSMFSLSACIVAALWGEAWLLTKVLRWLNFRDLSLLLVPGLAVAPFVVLGALIASVHVTRLLLRWRGSDNAY